MSIIIVAVVIQFHDMAWNCSPIDTFFAGSSKGKNPQHKNKKALSEEKETCSEQKILSLVNMVSHLLCHPNKLTLRSDVCAGGRHDSRWRRLFQSEYEKEQLQFNVEEEGKTVDGRGNQRPRWRLSPVCEKDTLMADNKGDIHQLMSQWIAVPLWDSAGCPLKPYWPVDQKPFGHHAVKLKNKGTRFLEPADICLLVRALYRLKGNVPDLRQLLEEVESWVSDNASLIEASHLPTLLLCLSEFSISEATKAVLNGLLEKVRLKGDKCDVL